MPETTVTDLNQTPIRGRKPSPTAEFVRYFNVGNAKIASVFLVTLFILYHGFIHIKYGKCIHEQSVKLSRLV